MSHILKLCKRNLTQWGENGYRCLDCDRRFLGKNIKEARKAAQLEPCSMGTYVVVAESPI